MKKNDPYKEVKNLQRQSEMWLAVAVLFGMLTMIGLVYLNAS